MENMINGNDSLNLDNFQDNDLEIKNLSKSFDNHNDNNNTNNTNNNNNKNTFVQISRRKSLSMPLLEPLPKPKRPPVPPRTYLMDNGADENKTHYIHTTPPSINITFNKNDADDDIITTPPPHFNSPEYYKKKPLPPIPIDHEKEDFHTTISPKPLPKVPSKIEILNKQNNDDNNSNNNNENLQNSTPLSSSSPISASPRSPSPPNGNLLSTSSSGWRSANKPMDYSYSNTVPRSSTQFDVTNPTLFSSSLNSSCSSSGSGGKSLGNFLNFEPTKPNMNQSTSLKNFENFDDYVFGNDSTELGLPQISPPVVRTRRQRVFTRKAATMKLVDNGVDTDDEDESESSSKKSGTLGLSESSIKSQASSNRGSFVMSKSSYNLRGSYGDENDEENDPTTNNNNDISNSNSNNNNNNNNTNNNKDTLKVIETKHGRTVSLPEEPVSLLIPNSIPSKKKPSLFNKFDFKSVIFEKIEEQQQKFESKPSRRSQLPYINDSTIFNKVIKEIIETEADYLDHMEITINFYLFAALEMVKYKILEKRDIFSIFSNFEEVYHISLKIYPMLLNCIPLLENNQYPNIEEVFLFNSKSFQRYGSYLSSHDSCNKFLQDILLTNQTAAQIFQKLIPICKLNNLHSFLIKPCQRLCKYPLLLKELGKALPNEDDQNHKTIKHATSLMEKIVSDINGKMKNDTKIQEIIKEIGTKDIEYLLHHQTFIDEGKVKKINKNGSTSEGTLYLFNQRIVFAEKNSLFTKKATVISLSNITRVCDYDYRYPSGFAIYHNSKNGSSSSNFGATLNMGTLILISDEKQKWINKIEDQIVSERVLAGTYTYVTNQFESFKNLENSLNKNQLDSLIDSIDKDTQQSQSQKQQEQLPQQEQQFQIEIPQIVEPISQQHDLPKLNHQQSSLQPRPTQLSFSQKQPKQEDEKPNKKPKSPKHKNTEPESFSFY
ncbi:hypothetical protein ACTFIU_003947 [Dictyostelium citrinum]